MPETVNELKKLGRGVEIVEEQRDKRPAYGFIADIFRGRASFENIFPWPTQTLKDVVKEEKLTEEVTKFLESYVDLDVFEKNKLISQEIINKMSELGLFAIKVPKNLGGKGLTHASYANLLSLIVSSGGPLGILVSADNTIGCKYAVLNYGTEEQREKYIPELIKVPSGFCFTEQDVGSDPARMKTYALRVFQNGKVIGYRLFGQKWYTTNVYVGKYFAVVAKIVNFPNEVRDSKCFGLFIVPANSNGIYLGPKNEFCGMRGIYNSNPYFQDVPIAPIQLIGEKNTFFEEKYGWAEREGSGFKIAMEALNTGRIAIAAGCLALAKQASSMGRWWSRKRIQWGKPIGRHELIGKGMLKTGAANIFAMEAMLKYTSMLPDKKPNSRHYYLEAAVCKVFNSEKAWKIADDIMQIFAGRGYEKYESLSNREEALPVEQLWRDTRPNPIFEGSSQILSQFVPRESMDYLFKLGFARNWKQRLTAISKFLVNDMKYLIAPVKVPEVAEELVQYLKFVRSSSRKFAIELFYFGFKYEKNLMFKQLTIWRFFWISAYLFAMTCVCAYADYLLKKHRDRRFLELADTFCRQALIEVENYFSSLHKNDDESSEEFTNKLFKGYYDDILDHGIITHVNRLGL